MPFFNLPPEQNRGVGQGRQRRPVPAAWGSAAAGKEGKRERRRRGYDSPTHLGRRWSVEGGRQWRAEVAGYGHGGGTADLGKGRAVVEMVAVAESCAEALFIGRERRWRGGRRWSSSAAINGGLASSGCRGVAARFAAAYRTTKRLRQRRASRVRGAAS